MRVKGVIMSLALHYWMGGANHCSAPPPRLRNDLYTVEWDVKLLYHTLPYHTVLQVSAPLWDIAVNTSQQPGVTRR